MDEKQRTTIHDIAREAQVSVSTVSRVMTGSAPVKAETKEKVLQIIKKYNYHPNGLARGLLYKQSKMIGVVLPDISHPFFSTLFLRCEARALELGYTTFLCNTLNDHRVESTYLQNLLEKQVDGIIFIGGRINDTEQDLEYVQEMKQVVQHLPVIMINGNMDGVDAYVVRSDEREGLKEMVRYLIRLGHTRIGFVGGRVGISSTDVKVQAFREVMEEQNLTASDDWIIHGDFSIESGESSVKELLKQHDLPTAIVCINDFVAIGAVRMLQKQGFRIPADFSVAGFDDIYLSNIFEPEITTVNQNYDMLGRTAVDVMIDVINGKGRPRQTVVDTELMIRDSCARLQPTE